VTDSDLLEPDADEIRDAWVRRIGSDLRRAIPNLRRTAARERRAAAIAAYRSRPEWRPLDPASAQPDPPGARLRRVGEVADPPPVRPVTRRTRRRKL